MPSDKNKVFKRNEACRTFHILLQGFINALFSTVVKFNIRPKKVDCVSHFIT